MAAIIKEARDRAGMSQRDLAKLLGITQGAVSMWEKGLSSPQLFRIRQIAEVLGIDDVELTTAAQTRYEET